MKYNNIVVYRGDLATARLNYKKLKRNGLRRFKKRLLKYWDISQDLALWDYGQYQNDKARKALGIEKNFLESTKNLLYFGVRLKPEVNADAVINLSEENKDYLRDKCLDIFNKYGKVIKTAYYDSTSYDYKTFKEVEIEPTLEQELDPEYETQYVKVETDFENAEDEELAYLLYNRLVMYMIDNDSTDTEDKWSDNNPNDFDYWTSFETTKQVYTGDYNYITVSEDARSKLKYFTYTFTEEDILKVINDRLFVKRNYLVVKNEEEGNTYKSTIDTTLIQELLDNGVVDNIIIDKTLWSWAGESYSLNVEAVKALPAEEFFLFIQAHLDTYSKGKTRWYQKGAFGALVVLAAIVVAYFTGQWQLVAIAVSVTGAVIGNKVMMIGGAMMSVAGSMQGMGTEVAAENAALSQSTRELARAGFSQAVLEAATQELAVNALLANASTIGNGMLDIFTTMSSLMPTDQIMPKAETPEEALGVIYIAENEYWDFIEQMMPEAKIKNALQVI